VPAVAFVALFAAEAVVAFEPATFGEGDTALWLWRFQGVAIAGVSFGIVWAWMRARRTRGRVARLVVDLAQSSRGDGLEGVLGELVGDPELRVVYPTPDGRWIDAGGHPTELPERPGRVLVPVRRAGDAIASLDLRAGIESDGGMLDEVVRAARLGLERERLQALTRATVEELRVSRLRIVEADDAERHRLERDLHDGTQQRLLGLALALRLAEASSRGADASMLNEQLERARIEVAGALEETRRIAHGLYPASLADDGLSAGIESAVESAVIPVAIVEVPSRRFPVSVERAAYLVAADAIAAPGAHRAEVAVRVEGDRLVVDIAEDGDGPAIDELQDRVAALDGTLVADIANGRVIIHAEIPCAS